MEEISIKPLADNIQEIVRVIIPALNEERSIGLVIQAIPKWVKEIIVVDNGSTDKTAEVAGNLGVTVVKEIEKGYGAACLAGMAVLKSDTEVVVFLDGDFSDFPGEMDRLVKPILAGERDLLIGSRVLGESEKGALLPVAKFGNALTTLLVKWIWGFSYSDLGPFRAIRYESLLGLKMADRDFGWTIEMQVKALTYNLRIGEVGVSYRKRIGKSKISGTILGSFRAGKKILYIVGREWIRK